jgi:hypothetical protein
MRNDARPIGEEARRQSPVPSHDPSPEHRTPPDHRDSVTHDPQSHIVNRRTEENIRRRNTDRDPTMPTGDPTLNIKI